MKKMTLSLLFATFTFLAKAQTDEAAIKDVIKQETEAFFNRDAKGMISAWHVIPQTTMYVFLPDRLHYRSADQLTVENMQKAWWQSPPINATAERSGWNIHVNGTSAYVTYEQGDLEEGQETNYSHQTRYMEKIAGAWKIVSSNVVFKKSE